MEMMDIFYSEWGTKAVDEKITRVINGVNGESSRNVKELSVSLFL